MYLSNSKAFTKYSNDKDDIYKNIEEYFLNKEQKILTVFDDMIADMLNNEKLDPVVTKYFACFYYTVLFCCTKKY